MESSVMSSWITEAGLSVQALAKKARKPITPKAKLANTKEVCCVMYSQTVCWGLVFGGWGKDYKIDIL